MLQPVATFHIWSVDNRPLVDFYKHVLRSFSLSTHVFEWLFERVRFFLVGRERTWLCWKSTWGHFDLFQHPLLSLFLSFIPSIQCMCVWMSCSCLQAVLPLLCALFKSRVWFLHRCTWLKQSQSECLRCFIRVCVLRFVTLHEPNITMHRLLAATDP